MQRTLNLFNRQEEKQIGEEKSQQIELIDQLFNEYGVERNDEICLFFDHCINENIMMKRELHQKWLEFNRDYEKEEVEVGTLVSFRDKIFGGLNKGTGVVIEKAFEDYSESETEYRVQYVGQSGIEQVTTLLKREQIKLS